MRIDDDNKAQIFEIKDKICKALFEEEKAINQEIQILKDHKITKEQIEEESVQLNGISYTSILVYLNETLEERDLNKMSHRAGPANAIVNYIQDQMGDGKGDNNERWRNFPRIIMKAITANTYFFTRMMENCQYK